MIARTSLHTKDVKLRPALPTDLDALVCICGESFPEYFRWRSIYSIGRNWWQVVLESQACKTLVLEDSIGIFAFDVLVLDRALWKAEGIRRNGTFIVRLLSALLCPVPSVWRRLWKMVLVPSIYRGTRGNRVVGRNCERMAWAEITAVLPRVFKQGYGTLLMGAREETALASGATAIETHTDSENIPTRRMLEKVGYVLIREDIGGCVYKKSLIDDNRGIL